MSRYWRITGKNDLNGNALVKVMGQNHNFYNIWLQIRFQQHSLLKNFRKSLQRIYSVSCDLSAAPAPGESAGPGTRFTLTEKDQSIPA